MGKKHIVVIGAGAGGLTGAMLLAHRGFRVTVFEARDRVGGRNAPLTLGDYTFDTGPTFLMMRFILEEMFAETGRRAEDYLRFTPLDPLHRLVFDDREMYSRAGHGEMRREIRRVFPEEGGPGLDGFMRREEKRFRYLFPCIQRPYSSPFSLLSPPLLRALPHLGLGRTIFSNLGRYFRNEKLKLAFTFQSKYLGMSPWDCPALFTMLPYIERGYGIHHVEGGLNRIPQAMARVVREEGGEIRTGTPVRELLVRRGAVKGVRLESGEDVAADDVLVNADFAHAMTSLTSPGTLKKYSPERLAAREFSCSTFMLYLGVHGTCGLPHHNIFFATDYRRNVDAVFHRKVLSDDMSLYVQNACATDPTLAPPGKSTLYILVPVPNRDAGIDWEREKPLFRELVLDIVAARAGIPGLKERIEVEKTTTPEDWERDYRIFKGATFNLSHRLGQLLYFRPHNRFEELDGCYLAGGGTHPGSGLPTIYESARISADLICRKHGVPYRPPSPLAAKRAVPG